MTEQKSQDTKAYLEEREKWLDQEKQAWQDMLERKTSNRSRVRPVQVQTNVPSAPLPYRPFWKVLTKDIPPGDAKDQPKDFWDNKPDGNITVWGDKHALDQLVLLANNGYIRDPVASQQNEGLIQAISRSMNGDVLRRHALQNINLREIFHSEEYQEVVKAMADRVRHSKGEDSAARFEETLRPDQSITINTLLVLAKTIESMINERRNARTQLNIHIVVCAPSQHYGGVRLLKIGQPSNQGDVTDKFMFICNTGAEAKKEEESSLAEARWTFGDSWSAFGNVATAKSIDLSDDLKESHGEGQAWQIGPGLCPLKHFPEDIQMVLDNKQSRKKAASDNRNGPKYCLQAMADCIKQDLNSLPPDGWPEGRSRDDACEACQIAMAAADDEEENLCMCVTMADEQTVIIKGVLGDPPASMIGFPTIPVVNTPLVDGVRCPPGETLPELPHHFKNGKLIYVGAKEVKLDGVDIKYSQFATTDAETYLTKVRKGGNEEELRRRNMNKNAKTLSQCLAQDVTQKAPKIKGWTDSVCKECEALGRECIVMVNMSWAYQLGVGSGTGRKK